MDKFEAYPTAKVNNASSKPRFSLRKVNYAVSPPGPTVGLKRSTRDDENSEGAQTEAVPLNIELQRKRAEAEYVETILKAIRDFFVVDTNAWLRLYYHTAVVRLQHINDHRNIAAICGELETSLQYWASWHAEQLLQNHRLDSEAECVALLDAYTLVLANWSARARRLRTCFAWIEVQFRQRDRRSQRGIIDSARKAIDTRFVRNHLLWDAVNTALDRIVVWSRPLNPKALARIALLEHVYSLKVLGLQRNPVFADPQLRALDQPSPYSSSQPPDSEIASAAFSPILRVLRRGKQHALQHLFLRDSPKMLEDWARRASYWTACLNTVFAFLIDEAQFRHRSPEPRARVQPEWHTSHQYLEEWLPLMSPHIASYALSSAQSPQLVSFMQSATKFPATLNLVHDTLAQVMRQLTEQMTSLSDTISIEDRINLLDTARSKLMALCYRNGAEPCLTRAMQEAVWANAGSLLVQLRRSVQVGYQQPFLHTEHQQTPLDKLQNLKLSLTLDEGQDDDLHSRMLAEDVAMDLLPTFMGGSGIDPLYERNVLGIVAGGFQVRGDAFTWMPVVMASEARRFVNGGTLLLHYVAWPATRDPLLSPHVPAALAPYVSVTESDCEIKWHPAWSVVQISVGNATFSCSAVQHEFIVTLLNSETPVSECTLVAAHAGDGDVNEAPLARRAALLDLVYNSRGFVKLCRTTSGDTEYAIDANELPSGSNLAVARFFEET